jgi:formate/nitrite transporter FocA (FNT family)
MVSRLKPAEIFERAAGEGRRRLDQGLLELTATGFIAGFTIVFGIIALGTVDALARPAVGELAELFAALAFGTELFSENFFDPVAAVFEPGEKRLGGKIARLWSLTFLFNLAGGALILVIISVEGVLPSGAPEALNRIAEEIVHREWLPTLTRAIMGGALVALMSFLVIASQDATARIFFAYIVGVLLALGPFDHAVVLLLHVGFGLLSDTNIGPTDALAVGLLVLAGNLAGGISLVVLSHAAQSRAAEKRA